MFTEMKCVAMVRLLVVVAVCLLMSGCFIFWR